MQRLSSLQQQQQQQQHQSEVFEAVRNVIETYLSLAHGGTPPDDFTPATPFMEAGLDSLDLLKVGFCHIASILI